MKQPSDIFLQLKKPFPSELVKWRLGATNQEKTKGIALAYIDSRDVQKRLDDVVGPDNWRDSYIPVNDGFVAQIELRISDEWIAKSDAAGNTKVEPIKGGASDSFKRAAAKWGIGRYLYYLPQQWVDIKPVGKSYAIATKPNLPKEFSLDSWERALEELAKDSGADDYEITYIQEQVNDLLEAQKKLLQEKKEAMRKRLEKKHV